MGKNTTNDMTQGNCMRLLVQFFLPILAGNLFQQLYSFADSMVVGKGIGDTALAAVGNTSSVQEDWESVFLSLLEVAIMKNFVRSWQCLSGSVWLLGL